MTQACFSWPGDGPAQVAPGPHCGPAYGETAGVPGSRRPRRRLTAAAAVLAFLIAAAPPSLAQIQTVEIEPVTLGAPGPDSTYRAGETFAVRFGYEEILPDISQAGVTARVRVGLTVEKTDLCAGDGRFLVCPYTVRTTDMDPNGVSVPNPSINDPRVVLRTTVFPVGYMESPQENHKVDGISVDMMKFQVVTDSTREAYRAGDVVRADVTFSENVEEFGDFAPMLVSGRPMVPVARTEDTRTYTHVVAPGEDMATLAVVGLWRPNDVVDEYGNAGIHCRAGQPKSLYCPAGAGAPRTNIAMVEYVSRFSELLSIKQSIDTTAPSVTGVRLRAAQALFGRRDNVDVVVEFDEPVTVKQDSAPCVSMHQDLASCDLLLQLDVGSTVKRIGLETATDVTDTRELHFRWPATEVDATEVERERIEGTLRVSANALLLSAAASVVDVAGNLSGNVSATRELGARVDSRPPQVRDVRVRAPREVSAGTVVRFDVTFDEDMKVAWPTSNACALPYLDYELVAINAEGTRSNTVATPRACLVGVQGRTLTLADVLPEPLPDVLSTPSLPEPLLTAERLELTPTLLSAMALGGNFGGEVTDAAGNAPGNHEPQGRHHLLQVAQGAGETPKPAAQSLVTDQRVYKKGGSVHFTLVFDRQAPDLSTTKLAFSIGGCEVSAGWLSKVDKFAHVFMFIHDDEPSSVCGGRGGRIEWGADALGESVDNVPVPTAGSGRSRVDVAVPEVTDVTIESRPRTVPAGGSAADLHYGGGARIVVAVTLTEPVQVACTEVVLRIGTATRAAPYLSGGGSARIRFSYRVRDGDAEVDRDGISVRGVLPCGTVNTLTTLTSLADALASGVSDMTDLAGNPVARDFGNHAIHDDGAHPVNGALRFVAGRPPTDDGPGEDPTDPTDDADTPEEPTGRLVLASSGGGADGSFGQGDTIVVRAEFAAPGVDVIAPLRIGLDIGGDSKVVTCTGLGRGRTFVECRYRVGPGDEDRDGVFVRIASGTIRFGDADVMPDLTALDPPAVLVDARAPSLASVELNTDPGADETYVTGDEIGVEITFSEQVSARGEISLPLRVGRALRRAELVSPAAGESATRFEFRYTVAAGDDDRDGVAVAALGPGSLIGALQDAAGHEAVLSYPEVPDDRAHVVDTLGPGVTGVEAVDPPGSGAYGEGAVVTLAMRFDEAVHVGAAGAALTLTVGTASREAAYVGGSGTSLLTFAYDVRGGDSGPFAVVAGGLRGVTDVGGNPARGNPAQALGVAADTSAPGVSGTPRLASVPEGGVYGVGDEVVVVVTFSERVLVVAGETGPSLRIRIGGLPREAGFAGGSGSDELRFVYVVAVGDEGDRISVAADALSLGDGAIRDVHGIDAMVRHSAVPATDGHRVDGVAPRVEGAAIVSRPEAEGAYLAGERIVVEVSFAEPVLGAEGAVLGLEVGSTARRAECATGAEATDALTCAYTVTLGDFDADGVAVVGDSFAGDFEDVAGNAAQLALGEIPDDPLHLVHAAPPQLGTPVSAMTLVVGGATASVDLAGVFRGRLTGIVASSDDDSVVAVSIAGSTLLLRAGIEGTATVTLSAANRAGREQTSFPVEVITDPAETGILGDAVAAIGRGMLAGTSELISARFRLAGDVSSLSLGGRRFTAAAAAEDMSGGMFGAARRQMPLSEARRQDTLALAGSGFDLQLAGRRQGVRWSLWGGADQYGLGGEPEHGEYDGTGMTGVVGIDARGETVVAGIAVARSTADVDYLFAGESEGEGTLETTFTAFHPYARLSMSADTELWVIAGFGSGEATAQREAVKRTELTDLDMAMAAAGLRRSLAIDFAGAAFSLHGDAAFMSVGSDDGRHALDGLALGVSRLRLALEGAWRMGAVAPFATVGARVDGGDGDSTGGVELAGGVRIGNELSAFSLEARGRVLALPFGDGQLDSGVSVTAAIEPGRLGRGFWLRLSPRWGADTLATDPFGHASAWDARTHAAGIAGAGAGWGMDAAFGYGLELRRLPGLLTPFAETVSAGTRRLRAGVRYRGGVGQRASRVEFAVERSNGPLPESRALIVAFARL